MDFCNKSNNFIKSGTQGYKFLNAFLYRLQRWIDIFCNNGICAGPPLLLSRKKCRKQQKPYPVKRSNQEIDPFVTL